MTTNATGGSQPPRQTSRADTTPDPAPGSAGVPAPAGDTEPVPTGGREPVPTGDREPGTSDGREPGTSKDAEATPATDARRDTGTKAEATPDRDEALPGRDDKASRRGKDDRSEATQDKTGRDQTDNDKTAQGKTDRDKDGKDKDGEDKTGTSEDGASKAGPGKDDKAGTGSAASEADRKDTAVEADPWTSFAPAPEPVPGRPRRAARATGRFLVHEWTLAVVASLALAVGMTWPTLRYPLYTLPMDYWDPSLQAWQMAWSGHALRTDPGQLFHSNTFFPEPWSFAFSDMLLGYAPAGLIGSGPDAAVLRYNIMFVLAHAMATFGAYVLARQLGAGRIGSAVAGVSYTYAPWLLAQAGHLHIVSNGGIPLALAMLARGHGWSLRHGYRPERRRVGWAYAGWMVAAWQLSLGFGIGLVFAYVLAAILLVSAVVWFWRRRTVRHPFGRKLFVADLVGGLLFAAVGALLAVPYFKVAELHPNAERTIGDIDVYSPPASGFFTAPAQSWIWGGLHEGARATLSWSPEMTLLPGFVLYALAAGGLFFSVWRLRHRLLLLAGVLVTMVLAMGTRFFDGTFTYAPLFEYLPGFNGLRTPGRMMLWTTLLLGVLAAGAVSAFAERVREISADRVPSWPSPWLRAATLLPLLLVTVEGLNDMPHPVVPEQPVAMRTVDGPLLVLPSGQNQDQPVMLWSTSRFQQVVNGGSGFTPRQLDDVRRVTVAFPDRTSVDYLRTLGVRNVVVLRDQIVGTPWEVTVDAPVDQLGITRQQVGNAVVFRL
ncbi:hypothetical protein ACIG87_10040 [Micromonospora sp. NPDC051925]|uniref:hypothetical protein n=1 Tax=Micromonospora sp. NPDC051925 TaxID=3364288 RepID=UPI0037CC215A